MTDTFIILLLLIRIGKYGLDVCARWFQMLFFALRRTIYRMAEHGEHMVCLRGPAVRPQLVQTALQIGLRATACTVAGGTINCMHVADELSVACRCNGQE